MFGNDFIRTFTKSKLWPARYGVAILATVAALLLRLALIPLIGQHDVPFITFFLAVLVSAWYGGLDAGLLTTLLSTVTAAYFFTYPPHSFWIPDPIDRTALAIFLIVGFGTSLLGRSLRQALQSANQEASLRRNAELAERSERQRLETTLASIGDGVIATDTEGQVRFMNTVAETLTGWNRDDALTKRVETVFRIVNENTRNPIELPIDWAIQKGRIANLIDPSILIARDGTEIPIEESGSLITDYEGRPTGAVLIFRDITERRRIEIEREASSRTSRQLADIVESSDDAILSKDPDLRITSWNHAAEEMFGYTASEAIGQTVRIIIPESRWSEEEDVMQLIRGGRKVEHHETERRRKDGTVIPVSVSISPVHGTAGVVVGASTIVRDITRQRAVEEEREARRAAEEASRAKDEFLAMLSHELRNPLSAINGWVALLKRGQVPPERVTHALEIIERNARRESQLVESLLDFSRIAANKLDLDMEGVDLSSLLEIVVDSMRPSAEAKGIMLDLTPVDDGSFVVIGDSDRLQQIFSNLLMNALKFTPRGGHVQVRLVQMGSQAQVQVIDDGEGIHADFLPYVFERFRQADPAKGRAYGGLGLGLAIVRELADAHGATVTAESRGKGRGSTFKVTLPIPAVLPDNITMATVYPEGVEEPDISGLRILVVDDEIDARELVGLALESRGAIIQAASSATEALNSLSWKPDVVISDIEMPDENGYGLIRKLRSAEREHGQRRLPAIALTAYVSNADRDQVLAAGFDLHLAKPVAIGDLIRAVDRVSQATDIELHQPRKSA
jgi:PAS domain S-box-containing protein